MNNLLHITFIGFFVGIIGTGAGGLIALILGKPGKKLLSFILGFSAGIMLTIVCFDLLPEAFERASFSIGLWGIILGVLMIIFIDEVSHRYTGNRAAYDRSFIKMGALIGLGIALHNFPEGLAIGSGFMAARDLGIGISIVIVLHNIPEGISMAAPMRVGGMSRFKVLIFTLLAGIPMGIGALIGGLLGDISQGLVAFCLAFAGGAMIYVTCGELIPSSRNLYIGRISTIGLVLGFIVGLFMTK